MPRPLRVLQFGLGPIGRLTARGLLRRPGFRLVGAADRDPALAGRDLGRVLGLRRRLGLPVLAEPDPLLPRVDLVLHTTVSSLAGATEQLRPILRAGVDVVSSTEEMAFPWWSRPQEARRLDRLARRGGAAVLGAGVNPGFALDLLPLVLSHACLRLRSVRVLRVQDAATRRPSLRLKVGCGLTPAAFRERARGGALGHVGLRESMDLVAAGLGWRPERYVHRLVPVLAGGPHPGPPALRRGQVAGQRETLRGYQDGRERLRFELIIALGARSPVDEIRLAGHPPLTLRIDGGTPGDAATAGTLINSAARVAAAPPGLHTPLDLPLPRHSPGAVRRRGRSPSTAARTGASGG